MKVGHVSTREVFGSLEGILTPISQINLYELDVQIHDDLVRMVGGLLPVWLHYDELMQSSQSRAAPWVHKCLISVIKEN